MLNEQLLTCFELLYLFYSLLYRRLPESDRSFTVWHECGSSCPVNEDKMLNEELTFTLKKVLVSSCVPIIKSAGHQPLFRIQMDIFTQRDP